VRITLLITSSIAAYKSPDIVRELVKRGHTVRVALSDGAKEFVTPLTLQTLSGESVGTNLFDLREESKIGHISLADDADVVLVAPATANFIAKAAVGIADDLPTTIVLATKARVIVAPAMNVNMWENIATQENIRTIASRGWRVIEPGTGELACGWEGKGRLAEISEIISAVEEIGNFPAGGSLAGRAVVVTAGPTREMLDPIRFITNRSSGRMGLALAREAKRRGAEVTLLSGPGVEGRMPDSGINVEHFESTLDLKERLKRCLIERTLPTTIFMAAAPGDYRGKTVSEKKLKKTDDPELLLELTKNPDIIGEIGNARVNFPKLERVVAFCAESERGEDLLLSAKRKLVEKGADFIVANSIEEGMGGDTTKLHVISKRGEVCSSEGGVPKSEAASWLFDTVFRDA
jgi:phosphopantothenoylcysteine decarboxylase / phosphopantothenate---cysteine ligase